MARADLNAPRPGSTEAALVHSQPSSIPAVSMHLRARSCCHKSCRVSGWRVRRAHSSLNSRTLACIYALWLVVTHILRRIIAYQCDRQCRNLDGSQEDMHSGTVKLLNVLLLVDRAPTLTHTSTRVLRKGHGECSFDDHTVCDGRSAYEATKICQR
jgi:hypothetical protein